MNRLIDMMTEVELSSKVLELYSGSPCLEKGWKRTNDLKQGLEALFAPAPHWSDNLEEEDTQTWVLCFVSDESAEDTCHVDWVTWKKPAYYQDCHLVEWRYATPVDLNVRFKKGD